MCLRGPWHPVAGTKLWQRHSFPGALVKPEVVTNNPTGTFPLTLAKRHLMRRTRTSAFDQALSRIDPWTGIFFCVASNGPGLPKLCKGGTADGRRWRFPTANN